MSVNFAAVHDHKFWRKHSTHQTLQAAIDGKDGAKNLLLRVGRVADMWRKYGDVQGVFVWEDDAELGQAFRIDPKKGTVQSINIAIDKILRFHKDKGCSPQEIAECFADETLPTAAGTVDSTRHPTQKTLMVGTFYPDELPQNGTYHEGMDQQVLVNRFERSPEARNACIAHHGPTCQVCHLDFSERYGELGAGFIHVHHRMPISSVGSEYRIDPIKDLVPVCPNCHAMLHRREPPLEIEELRALVL
jgi:hypothetical protein